MSHAVITEFVNRLISPYRFALITDALGEIWSGCKKRIHLLLILRPEDSYEAGLLDEGFVPRGRGSLIVRSRRRILLLIGFFSQIIYLVGPTVRGTKLFDWTVDTSTPRTEESSGKGRKS